MSKSLSSLAEHSCANCVKESVVAEGISGDQPKEAEEGRGGLSNSSSSQEHITSMLTPSSCGVVSCNLPGEEEEVNRGRLYAAKL